MIALTVAMLILIVPALQLMLTGAPWQFAVGQVFMAVTAGMALGMQGAMLVEIFPLRTRVTSMSFAYSMTLALAGGTAPLVSAWLVQRLGSAALTRGVHHGLRGGGPGIVMVDEGDQHARARRLSGDAGTTSADARSFAARSSVRRLSSRSNHPEMTMMKAICAITAMTLAGSSLATADEAAPPRTAT